MCLQANEQSSADRLADGFIEMAEKAAGEQAGRQQAEQVLSQAVSGTIQWLDQVLLPFLCLRNSNISHERLEPKHDWLVSHPRTL